LDESLRYTRDMIKCLSGVDFCVIENSSSALTDYFNSALDGLFFALPTAVEPSELLRLFQPNCVYEFRTAIGLQSILFLAPNTNRLFLLGPCLSENYSEITTQQKLRQLSLPQHTIDSILSKCAQLPLVSIHTLHQLSLLLISQFTGSHSPISYRTVNLMPEPKEISYTQPQNEIPLMRQVESRYEMSTVLTEAVKQGNFSMALSLLRGYHPGLDNEIRNSDPLRNLQNYCIILNTQLRHALEDCGIHPYRLDRLSSQIGLEIESMHSTDNSQEFVFSAIQRYCQLVRESAYPHLKPLIHLAVTYIKEHLNEDLTVKEAARILGVNANYLSTQFHKEMGLTFIDFIHRERSNQAAALLKHTNLQIQQIASSVGYNNTSYFVRQFTRFLKMSPSQFRREGTM